MSEDSIKISSLTMRILFELGLYSNADSIQEFTVFVVSQHLKIIKGDGKIVGD